MRDEKKLVDLIEGDPAVKAAIRKAVNADDENRVYRILMDVLKGVPWVGHAVETQARRATPKVMRIYKQARAAVRRKRTWSCPKCKTPMECEFAGRSEGQDGMEDDYKWICPKCGYDLCSALGPDL